MAVVGQRDHAGVSRLKDLSADVVVDELGLHHPEPDVREVVPGKADDGSWRESQRGLDLDEGAHRRVVADVICTQRYESNLTT